MAVYKAIINEVSGKTHWWMPDLAFKLKGDVPVDQVGAVFQIIANPTKRLKAKFFCRVKKVVEAQSVDLDIFAGDVIGKGQWTFQEINGKTKIKVRFTVKSNNLLISLFSPFVDLAKQHSNAVQNGFKACNRYLCC